MGRIWNHYIADTVFPLKLQKSWIEDQSISNTHVLSLPLKLVILWYSPINFSHNGVIYVIGGDDGTSNLSSVEMYNPKVEKENIRRYYYFVVFQTDTWNVLAANMTIGRSYTGVAVIDRPSFLWKASRVTSKWYLWGSDFFLPIGAIWGLYLWNREIVPMQESSFLLCFTTGSISTI